MSFAVSALPDDVSALKSIIAEMSERFDKEIAGRDLLIEKLQHQLDAEKRHRYGASSEATRQLQLILEGEETTQAAMPPIASVVSKVSKQPARRKPLPDHLERRDQVLEVDRTCTACGGVLKQVSEDVTEELDYIPGRFVVKTDCPSTYGVPVLR